MPTDYDTEYARYTTRFDANVGSIETGQHGRYRGRLVKKFSQAEFVAKVEGYMALGQRFNAIVAAGDTMDDTLALDLRAMEVELVLDKSLFLPTRRKRDAD